MDKSELISSLADEANLPTEEGILKVNAFFLKGLSPRI